MRDRCRGPSISLDRRSQADERNGRAKGQNPRHDRGGKKADSTDDFDHLRPATASRADEAGTAVIKPQRLFATIVSGVVVRRTESTRRSPGRHARGSSARMRTQQRFSSRRPVVTQGATVVADIALSVDRHRVPDAGDGSGGYRPARR